MHTCGPLAHSLQGVPVSDHTEAGKASYSTPKLFRPIVLLNMLGKLVEKMLACRLQFNRVAHNAFEPNQFGGVAQRSTEDAGIYLTHLVRAGWAKGLQTSVVAFDIAQFFPLLNHEVLFEVFSRLGFPVVLGPFLCSYLVGQRTTYKWDSFTSDPFAADMGVGQGSAMSPVLSALYLTLIMRRFRTSDISQKVDLIMSYVDDGTIVTQSHDVKDNLPLLKDAYGWMFHAFESLGLVLEHDKSEVFHFSRARSFVGPAIDLRYAPYTGTTPLRPKPVWRYLGFFFDRKLQFKEHAHFYMTRAFMQVHAMGMLGNSVRGLEPDQKRLLYRSCVVPVITYGFCLWYFKGAHVKGLIKAMSQVQHTAARWICGNFRTTLGGGAECLRGLLPMHLTLCCLADRGPTRVPMLARSHPLRSILGEAMEGCHQAHPLALVNSGPLSVTSLQGAAVDMAVGASALWQDKCDPFGPDSQPGNRVVDVFQSHFHRHGPASKKDEDIAKYRDQLDLAWAEAYVDESCCVVAVDASVPTGGVFQAAAAALVYRQGDVVSRVVSAAGRRASPEVKHFALQLGISVALAKGCQKLVVISDSLPAVESLFSVELWSGQIFSLDCCHVVGPWLAGDPERSVHLWFVPSCMEWGTQKAAHDIVVSLKIAVGRRPWTSCDFMRQCADIEASKDWCELFKDPSYCGHSFFFFFFKSKIYYAELERRPWQTIQTKYSLQVYKNACLEGECCPDIALSSGCD
jgi:hypothetical protein